MKRNKAISAAWAWFVLITVVLGSTAWAAEVGRPRPTPLAPARGPRLVEKALRAIAGAEEIVFAVRGLYEDGHYYATFGHWSSDPNKMMYAAGGSRLCKLNLRTKQLTVLLDDPAGGVRDPRVHDVRLSGLERKLVQLWIDTGATYAGTYAAFNSSDVAVAGALANSREVAIGKPLAPVVERRCLTCHGSAASLGQRA